MTPRRDLPPGHVHRRWLEASLDRRVNRRQKRAAVIELAGVIKREGVHLCITTEGSSLHVKVLRQQIGRTHGVEKVGEYIYIWRRGTYAERGGSALRILTFTLRIAAWRQFLIGLKRFADREAGTYHLFSGGHGPGTVAHRNGWKTGLWSRGQVKTAKKGWPKWGGLMRARMHHHRGKAWIGAAFADSNLHQGVDWQREWLHGQMGGIPAWTPRTLHGEPGTLGGRTVDVAFFYPAKGVAFDVVDVNVIKAQTGDHDWVLVDVEYGK